MADRRTAWSTKRRPRKLLFASWVLSALSVGAFGLALANNSFGALLTTIILLLATWSAAIFLSLAELSVRSEQRFREQNADRE